MKLITAVALVVAMSIALAARPVKASPAPAKSAGFNAADVTKFAKDEVAAKDDKPKKSKKDKDDKGKDDDKGGDKGPNKDKKD